MSPGSIDSDTSSSAGTARPRRSKDFATRSKVTGLDIRPDLPPETGDGPPRQRRLRRVQLRHGAGGEGAAMTSVAFRRRRERPSLTPAPTTGGRTATHEVTVRPR